MEKFSTYFGLKLAHLGFVATEQLATTLQAKDVIAQLCMGAVGATKAFLQRQRDETAFFRFFESVSKESTSLTDQPTLPRRKNNPFQSPSEYFRQQYFELFDVLTEGLDNCFCQQSLMVLHDIEI